MTESLDDRITRLEDIEAIKQLKAKYCEACDDNNNADKVAAIFTEDGIWDGGDSGFAEGRDAIKKLFSGASKVISFSQHNVMNPIIEVNGDRATGIWYLMGPFTMHKNEGVKMMTMRYDDEYVKVNGEWKISRLKGTTRLLTDLNAAS